jgi:LmbE family N-acetylglucosaminyl deacetylase
LPNRNITELLQRTLLIVAHPDDECIGAGALLQRMEHSLIVFCTDGGPRDSGFWQSYGSREVYANTRRREAELAAHAVGVEKKIFLPIVDQELYLNLDCALRELEKAALEFRPNALLTLAYEGGHPDHDCCAFLGSVLGMRQNLPVFETPLYHRTSQGARSQQFPATAGNIHRIRITSRELEQKEKMRSAYRSQASVIAGFDLKLESFRRQAPYDFLRPPPVDVINYEVWGWLITAKTLCAAFAQFKKTNARTASPRRSPSMAP